MRRRRRTVVIHVGAYSFPDAVGAGFGSIWISAHRGYVAVRVDPRTNRTVAHVRLGDSNAGRSRSEPDMPGHPIARARAGSPGLTRSTRERIASSEGSPGPMPSSPAAASGSRRTPHSRSSGSTLSRTSCSPASEHRSRQTTTATEPEREHSERCGRRTASTPPPESTCARTPYASSHSPARDHQTRRLLRRGKPARVGRPRLAHELRRHLRDRPRNKHRAVASNPNRAVLAAG